jgi:ATP-dependent DNA helicase HFM1/MER3
MPVDCIPLLVATPDHIQELQVNEALSDHPTEKLDYSMKQELEQVLRVGMRIAACMAK